MARRKRVSVINARVVPGVVVFAQLWLRSEAGCNEARVRLWTTAPARLDEYVSLALSPTTTSLGPSDALTNPVARSSSTAQPAAPAADQATTITRLLLATGLLTGPLFIGLAYLQLARSGLSAMLVMTRSTAWLAASW